MCNQLWASELTSINWLHGYMAVWISGSLVTWEAVHQESSGDFCMITCVDSRVFMLLFLYIGRIMAGELPDFLLADIARLLYAHFDA